MPQTIVIADDITGAGDIGIMYAGAGMKTMVYDGKKEDNPAYEPCDVLILDTDSRLCSPEEAYSRVYRKVRQVSDMGAGQYINKQCSVFRGNIGAEFDAMLDAMQEEFAVVVLGFPDNGRTTLHGIHYVDGIPLERSQFRNDPVHPMRKSSLKDILQQQTGRRVDNIWYETYEGGEEAVRQAVEEKRKKGGYCIMDVRDNRDLELLAGALRGEKILCGSSALSGYLARLQAGDLAGDGGEAGREHGRGRVLGVAGSLMPQTAAQTEYLQRRGYPVFTLDTRLLFAPEKRCRECGRILEAVGNAYESAAFVMIRTAQDPDIVKETKRQGAALGMGNVEISAMVSEALSEVALQVIRDREIRDLIVCGGDTSAAICERLEVRGMQVLEEIETGLPLCGSVGRPSRRLVLKSGSFGSRTFLEKALTAIRQDAETLKHLDRLMERYPQLEECRRDILAAYEKLREVYERKGMLLICGNGGSGADSEHIAGELMKEFALRRPLGEEEQDRLKKAFGGHGTLLAAHLQGSLPAIALTGHIALSTAYANDAAPELVFAQQVYGYGTPESGLLGISTSGNSLNVIYALEVARSKGMTVLGLTGESGGRMKGLCDVCICVPARETADIQELHLPVYHTLCKMLEEVFFG